MLQVITKHEYIIHYTQLLKYNRIQSPITIVESGPLKNLVFDLKSDVFTFED